MVRPGSADRSASPLILEPEPSAASAARRYVEAVLTGWGYGELLEAAALGVSELVTNAAIHARTVISVQVLALPRGGVRIEVMDGSAVVPQPRAYRLTSSVGRGLRMLDGLGAWGHQPQLGAASPGKVVWFEPAADIDETAFLSDPVTDWGLDDILDDEPASPLPASDAGGSPAHAQAVLGRYNPPGRDDEVPHASATGLVTVRMLRFPLRVFSAAREHHDELMREFALLAMAPAPQPGASAVPQRLVELIEVLGGRHRAASERADAVRDAALARGQLSINLTYHVPATIQEPLITLERLLEEADQFCRDEHLLTLAIDPLLRQFSRWFTNQFIEQIDGAVPTPWTGALRPPQPTIGSPAPGRSPAAPQYLDRADEDDQDDRTGRGPGHTTSARHDPLVE